MQRDFDKHPRCVHAGDVPDDGEMPVARDRKKLSQSLYDTEQDALPEGHATFPATSATSPTTMEALRSRLTRSTRLATSQAAATRTANCAGSASR